MGVDVFRRDRLSLGPFQEIPLFVYRSCPTADLGIILVTVEKGNLLFQSFGVGEIIAVEHRNIFAARELEAGIPSSRYASIPFIADDSYARIHIGSHTFQTQVGRTVINKEQFVVGKFCAKMLSIAGPT